MMERSRAAEETTEADEWLRDVYQTQWAALVRLAALLLGSSDRADEVVQDAILATYRRRGRLEGSPIAYLRQSVVNGCRSVLRHRAVVVRTERLRLVPAPGPEEQAMTALTAERVVRAMRTLSQRQQEVLILRYYSDLSESEIAQALGISAGAVKSHGHRAVAALRATLSEESLR